MERDILVIGSSPAGLQAANNLADLGLNVHLVENSPFIGSASDELIPAYKKNTYLLEILKHPRIQVWTNAEILDVDQAGSRYQVKIQQNPRYVDLNKCTACKDCLEVCPIIIPGLDQKAISFGGQPDCAVISKSGISPCSNACPAGIHVQGYVALINQGLYREAYNLVDDALPFPSVCGKVCNHLCETSCTRSQLDEAVNIMGLKGFLADWAYSHQEQFSRSITSPPRSGKKVAVIGAGPTGLTAARDLNRLGHQVKIFDAHSEPGGMMRVGIPPHRVSYDQLGWEIERILAEGIDIQLNTWVDDVPELLADGFDAVLVAAGAGVALKPKIKNADHEDNWLSLDFLKRVSLGIKDNIKGRDVIVLGGGDVAMDAARSALRLGVANVKIICRGIRASEHELQATIEEGIEIIRDRVFKEVSVSDKKITGMLCLKADVGEVVDGKRHFKEIPGTEHIIPGDLVIWALGQKIDPSFLPDGHDILTDDGWAIQTNENLMTSLNGVFAAGDFRQGNTTFVVDAVGEGHLAAKAIHNFLHDRSAQKSIQREQVILSQEEMAFRLEQIKQARMKRTSLKTIPVKEREGNFQLVDLPLSEEKARKEAGRCLVCGPCSECMACVEVCEPDAIVMNQIPIINNIQVSAIFGDAQRNGNYLLDEHKLSGSASVYGFLSENKIRPIVSRGQIKIQEQTGDQDQRTGLIICQCGGEISSYLDTSRLCLDALALPEVDFSTELAFSCTDEGADNIKLIARENKLDKIILAACSCCSLDQVCYSCTYQRLRCRENLDTFSSLQDMLPIEFINIREQCAWAYPRSKSRATDAALVLISSALSREPADGYDQLSDPQIPTRVMVVGNGPSVQSCLSALQDLGLDTVEAAVMADDIIRVGAGYQADWHEKGISVDCLILAPGSMAELDHISSFVKSVNNESLLPSYEPEGDYLDYGLTICPPDLDPDVSGTGAALALYAWINRITNQVNKHSATVDPFRCRACGTCQEVCGYGIPGKVTDQYGPHAYINPLFCLDCGTCTAHCPTGAIIPGTNSDRELENMLGRILTNYG